MQSIPRKLHLRTCRNVRELGGYDTPTGPTRAHRFLRAGGTRSLTPSDLQAMRDWGVTRVIDLRSVGESPRITCTLSRQPWVTWENVPLYDVDISAPTMMPSGGIDNYLVSSYLHMLAGGDAIRRVFEFCAKARPDECVLFHCAAGMDRTGMVSMLLLGLAGVPRHQIVADYAYSFGSVTEVDAAVEAQLGGRASVQSPLEMGFLVAVRIEAIAAVYDTVVQTHGSVESYLKSCGIPSHVLDTVRRHLVG